MLNKRQKILLIIILLAIIAGVIFWYQYGRKHPIFAQTNNETNENQVNLPPVQNIKAGVLELDSENFPPIP